MSPSLLSRRRVLQLAVPFAAAMFAACGDDDRDDGADAAGSSGSSEDAGAATASSLTPRRSPTPPPSTAGGVVERPGQHAPVDVVVTGVNAAGFELQRHVFGGQGVVLSPASLAAAFALAAAGADEATRAELDAAFGFPPGADLHEAMGELLGDVVAGGDADSDAVVEIAHGVWAQDGVQVGAEFRETVERSHGAVVETTDFAGNQEGSRQAINAWIAEVTHDRIPEMIGPPGLDPATVFALVNAVYLKAPWTSPFPVAATAPAPFRTLDGGSATVDMMRQQLTAKHVLDEDLVAVRLPYADGTYLMTIVMPDDLAAFVAGVNPEQWADVAAFAVSGPVDLRLPRWHTSASLDLAAALAAMGVTVPGGSYPGIAEGATVGTVLQAADITVDEAGTEAAAASVIAGPTAAPAEPPVEITFDGPFVYTIEHVPTGLILFAGIETDPSA